MKETNTGHIASAEHAADELATLIGRCANLADYLVLNLSCPNMPGGKGLFDMSAQLQNLLRACARNASMPPLFLKINPPGDPCDARSHDRLLCYR